MTKEQVLVKLESFEDIWMDTIKNCIYIDVQYMGQDDSDAMEEFLQEECKEYEEGCCTTYYIFEDFEVHVSCDMGEDE